MNAELGVAPVEQPEVTNDELRRVSAYLLYWAKKDAAELRKRHDALRVTLDTVGFDMMNAKVIASIWLDIQVSTLEDQSDG